MEDIYKTIRSYKNNADIIIPRLWLGNFNASQDVMFLKANQISVVFNCTKDLPFQTQGIQTMTQYRVPIDDNLEPAEIRNLSLWSHEAVYKLMSEYKKGNHILVHCAAGMQRSAAVVAMFLIANFYTRAMEAMLYIKKRRPIAFFPGANFNNAIVEFDATFHNDIMPKLGYLPGHIPEDF